MQEQRAEALQLAVGKPASLMQNGSARPITREPLSDAQIQGLLREIASADTQSQLGSAETVAFAYRSPYGEVQVERKPGANGVAVLRPAGAGAAAATPPAFTPPPAAPAAPSPIPSASPSPVARCAPRSPAASPTR